MGDCSLIIARRLVFRVGGGRGGGYNFRKQLKVGGSTFFCDGKRETGGGTIFTFRVFILKHKLFISTANNTKNTLNFQEKH